MRSSRNAYSATRALNFAVNRRLLAIAHLSISPMEYAVADGPTNRDHLMEWPSETGWRSVGGCNCPFVQGDFTRLEEGVRVRKMQQGEMRYELNQRQASRLVDEGIHDALSGPRSFGKSLLIETFKDQV